MTRKTARRWLNRNEWKVTKAQELGRVPKQMMKQFNKCLRALRYKL